MRRTRLGALIALPLTATLVAACSQPAGSSDSGELSIATGSTSGVYYPIGGAIAEIVNSEVDETSSSAEATGASVENLRMIDSGQADLAIVQADAAFQSVNAEGPFADEPVEARVLAVLYPNVYHSVSLQSIHKKKGLDCFSDVEGSRFSVGPPGSGNELATDLVFESLGLSFEDIKVQRLAYAETATALRDGKLDAGSWVVGAGHGSLRELEATDPLHLIPLCDDEQQRITEEHPFYIPHTIPGGTYASVPDDVDTLALWNVLVVGPDFPEEKAYEITQALYDNVDRVASVYQPITETLSVDTLVGESPIPLHPGAVRYAEEQGTDVPAELRGE
ncbi:TAXI family TRAP transporter solute-binding subunit [Nocardioides sp.]|uniref:TAXI family TRAP transporter solute-binding subunit n=1 Tax=Nocardioides sp. TaxID=35761 RepID=UPI00273685B3|nr:TAXI family TRAP transporter solute-binding subunit [Nocardioides sp.]MDP3891792.1 TAXI family TRAP transporter solute-binding subunit [Nocardioides sp.]